MPNMERADNPGTTDILPEQVPVVMPDIPLKLVLTTDQQWKAINDPLRKRILNVIQYQPATAKMLATRLGITPGAMGHHLHTLEEAGLVQVVARRLVRGIVAKYYTRTARIFDYDLPPEIVRDSSIDLDLLVRMQEDFAEMLTGENDDFIKRVSYPRARLSEERIHLYQERLNALITDFLQESGLPENNEGQVYNLCVALFRAPDYVQKLSPDTAL
jgi:DNA-binding transcriptional ArsR family regulator